QFSYGSEVSHLYRVVMRSATGLYMVQLRRRTSRAWLLLAPGMCRQPPRVDSDCWRRAPLVVRILTPTLTMVAPVRRLEPAGPDSRPIHAAMSRATKRYVT